MSFHYELIIIVLMLAVNAVFAAYEMALASISRARLATLCQQKKKGAEEAAYMKDRMEASLAVVQLGITFAAAVAAATGGAGAQELFVPYFSKTFGMPDLYARILAVFCIVIPLSAFTIIFAELVPKMSALNNREAVCLGLSPLMMRIAKLANPVVSFFEVIVKKVTGLSVRKALGRPHDKSQSLHELYAAAALARASLIIGAQEEKIVLSAAQLPHRRVTDIMLPAADISMLYLESGLSEAFVKAHLDMHTRFPVCKKEADPQSIVGYVNFKDILNSLKLNPANPSLQGIVRPIKKLSEQTTLAQALSELMHERAHIALVVSSDQTTLGMITLEDIIEELVGEIEDEFDRLPTHIQACGSGWIMGGGVPMSAVVARLGIETPSDIITANRSLSLSDWLVIKLGRAIEPGEILSFADISVAVRKLRRKKLAEALVSKV